MLLFLNRLLPPGFLGLGLMVCLSTTAMSADYEFTLLNDRLNPQTTVIWGLNDAGTIVGTMFSGGRSRGLMLKGMTTTLFDVPGETSTVAHDINNHGHIVGSGGERGFITQDLTNFTRLNFPGAAATAPSGINDHGHIVGIYNAAANQVNAYRGFLYINGTWTTIDYPGSQATAPSKINNDGTIVGYYLVTTQAPNFSIHAFVRDARGVWTTIQIPGATFVDANGIDNAGRIVGEFGALASGQDVSHGFLKVGDTVTTVDYPGESHSRLIDINNFGEAIGDFVGPVLTQIAGFFIARPAHGGGLAAAVLPGSRAVQVGQQATAFATIFNAGTATATGCSIALINAATGTMFAYQQTNAQNVPIGTPNTPIDIPANDFRTFIFSLSPSQAFTATDLHFNFDCTNTSPAPDTPGVNTFLLTSSPGATPDIVALSAAVGGIVSIPGPTGIGAFAVATVNVGASAPITVTADTGSAQLPLTLTLCQTNPATGQCINPPTPASSVTTQIDANQTPTFAVFAQAAAPIAFSPGVNRVHVRFKTQAGGTVGATSVAVQTQ